ncbi:undecaprenyl-diphosphatase UppP [Candidatus Falkowbacteria bacterium CG10_big_fil_rev_8_21_14_0_10_43_10]|uniref:Undecaprenyl-diphosphatase n=1 Tax=Candidatus Falkowbacteria bacterium CG10_big_fil_rev_8_21_14_0_10_43_10 TaxID=1974567 RepID=A0A2H0V2A7_9BACT|nr:MAG: undecaprenyl-diphosphatase UppP [Candidatus Falkowbacteria bacterium CG10_big_fil_rev_8_21_14_0_10_43_10]
MDNYFIIAIFSVIQGITEFLPISSSGHLVLLHNIFTSSITNELTFDVVLHLASAFAVILFFWSDLIKIAKNWFKSLIRANFEASEAKLGWFIILATIPAALAGYFFEDFIKNYLRSNLVVALMLIVIGVLFLLTEKYSKHKIELADLTWRRSLLIGAAQALALVPGASRSGITIIAGMAADLKRKAAVKFSFLLSIPVILGANIKEILSSGLTIPNEDIFSFSFGFIIAWVVSYFVIKYFIVFVKKYSLNIFAYYRFALAAIILFLWLAQQL